MARKFEVTMWRKQSWRKNSESLWGIVVKRGAQVAHTSWRERASGLTRYGSDVRSLALGERHHNSEFHPGNCIETYAKDCLARDGLISNPPAGREGSLSRC